jgi:hypothetical protein
MVKSLNQDSGHFFSVLIRVKRIGQERACGANRFEPAGRCLRTRLGGGSLAEVQLGASHRPIGQAAHRELQRLLAVGEAPRERDRHDRFASGVSVNKLRETAMGAIGAAHTDAGDNLSRQQCCPERPLDEPFDG